MFEGLTFKVAQGVDRDRALELRRTVYEEELGYHGVDDFDKLAYQLIAVDETGDLVSALRIIGPGQRPFEIEQFVELAVIVRAGSCPAQIGGFCIRKDRRPVSRQSFLSLGMLRFAYVFARRQQITDFVMRTHVEQLRDFYRRAFFRVVNELAFHHPLWGPVYVMHLDLIGLEQRWRETRDPIARFMVNQDLPHVQF